MALTYLEAFEAALTNPNVTESSIEALNAMKLVWAKHHPDIIVEDPVFYELIDACGGVANRVIRQNLAAQQQ